MKNIKKLSTIRPNSQKSMDLLGMGIACCAARKIGQFYETYAESSFAKIAGKTRWRNVSKPIIQTPFPLVSTMGAQLKSLPKSVSTCLTDILLAKNFLPTQYVEVMLHITSSSRFVKENQELSVIVVSPSTSCLTLYSVIHVEM